MDARSDILPLLERLSAVDTRNPPRAIDPRGIFEVIEGALGEGFTFETVNLGDGCLSLLAVRGAPTILFNIHVDTVPADPGWRDDPFRLRVEGERAIGLGACDIKGAAAALIVAARRTKGDVAMLFSSDEEAGSSLVVRTFLDKRPSYRGVVIAEPTRCRAVLEHRGIATATGTFKGEGGHASSPRALDDSAVHEAVRWASRALAFAEDCQSRHYGNLSGIRFNLGVMNGGTKANMIAASTELRFGVRPLPDQKPLELIDAITGLAPRPERVTWTPGFIAPPLPSNPSVLEAARALAAELGLPISDPVDFWTEAALFSGAGLPSLVYGPGDIAQPHTAGEWVRIEELVEAEATYRRILAGACRQTVASGPPLGPASDEYRRISSEPTDAAAGAAGLPTRPR